VKAISADGTVSGLGRPLGNLRELLVTTPTILVKQDETDGNGGHSVVLTRPTACDPGDDGFAGRLSLIALECVF
jgi:hypothetical protein